LLNHCGQFLPLANRNTHMTRYYTARNWIRLLVAASRLNRTAMRVHADALGFLEWDANVPTRRR
jgi:hypothetical protein